MIYLKSAFPTRSVSGRDTAFPVLLCLNCIVSLSQSISDNLSFIKSQARIPQDSPTVTIAASRKVTLPSLIAAYILSNSDSVSTGMILFILGA